MLKSKILENEFYGYEIVSFLNYIVFEIQYIVIKKRSPFYDNKKDPLKFGSERIFISGLTSIRKPKQIILLLYD